MPESDMTVSIDTLQRGKLEAEKMRGSNGNVLMMEHLKDQLYGVPKVNEKEYAGPDPTGKAARRVPSITGVSGHVNCGQARLNHACAWGGCAFTDNLPPNLKKGLKVVQIIRMSRWEKGIAGIRHLSSATASDLGCLWIVSRLFGLNRSYLCN